MKISYTGLNLPEGKTKHDDPQFNALVEKFQPDKVSPYYFELLSDAPADAMAIAVTEDTALDLLLPDMEMIETRLSNAADTTEQAVLKQCLEHLESQQPLCDLELPDTEAALVNALDVQSRKPTIIFADPDTPVAQVCDALMKRAGMMFFYTAGKQEVHAWFVRHHAPAIDCAERIHTDLARGFIRAEIVSVENMLTAHSMQDANKQGLTQLVERAFPIEENTVLEIRFNV